MFANGILTTVQRALRLALFLTVFLSACSDPYSKKLPLSARLTPGEAEEIAQKLSPADQALFRRWADRQTSVGAYGGEGSAPFVRIALLNQAAFEARQQETLEAEKAEKALVDKVAREQADATKQQQLKLEQVAKNRRAVDSEIRKYFSARAVDYVWRPVFNSRGEEFARQWDFKLRLTNKSTKTITGAAGWATFTDVFNADLGSYPMKIEPQIKSGQTVDFIVTMDHDRKNPRHLEMSQSKTLRITWFFESVAFSDGTNVDYQAIAENVPAPGATKAKATKPPAL